MFLFNFLFKINEKRKCIVSLVSESLLACHKNYSIWLDSNSSKVHTRIFSTFSRAFIYFDGKLSWRQSFRAEMVLWGIPHIKYIQIYIMETLYNSINLKAISLCDIHFVHIVHEYIIIHSTLRSTSRPRSTVIYPIGKVWTTTIYSINNFCDMHIFCCTQKGRASQPVYILSILKNFYLYRNQTFKNYLALYSFFVPKMGRKGAWQTPNL